MSFILSSPTSGIKRAYQHEDPSIDQPILDPLPSPPLQAPTSSGSAASSFRNISACHRCRTRKNKCDQLLPACGTCTKANVRCVGYDPTTKREIPRSYVYFLETRLTYFESLLKQHNIGFDATDVYDASSKPLEASSAVAKPPGATESSKDGTFDERKGERWSKTQDDKNNIDNLVSNIGMVSVKGTSDARYLGTTSGISFARVVLAAVKSSMSANNSERKGTKPSQPLALSSGSTMRDSYFGLQTKPTIEEASFPDRAIGEKLVHLYFEIANPQIPILHRDEFMDLFDHAYSVESPLQRTARELYFLNIVFAVGAGTLWMDTDSSSPESAHDTETPSKRPRLANRQAQPEQYHASAIVHLGSLLGTSSIDNVDRPGGDLEELQAVLLLAAFALMRPVAPGLWYIVGVAMRLAVDLGLHYEDGSGIDVANHLDKPKVKSENSIYPSRRQGKREWMRDLRRRLWWCTYNFDRLVSTCVGRPFGITDQAVTTEFPSLLDDKYIARTGFSQPPHADAPTYKLVTYHYLRLRLLQSEILQVLQHQQAKQARRTGVNQQNEFIHSNLPSPFLSKFSSFRSWRMDIDQRLYEWKECAPKQVETGVKFDPKFIELNYWQAVIMLYRQSLSTPVVFANELSPTGDVGSPSGLFVEEKEDENLVFLKCAEAGQKTLKLYRQLHRQRLVNYTYLATHHLFMAGISFLYAVWHSPVVRSQLSLDDFDFTVLAATSVLGDLIQKCPPAEACRDAFDRMSKATVQMCLSKPGFGLSQSRDNTPRPIRRNTNTSDSVKIDPQLSTTYQAIAPKPMPKRPPPQFDMDLRGLFPDDLDTSIRPSSSFPANFVQKRRQQSLSQATPQSSSSQTDEAHLATSSLQQSQLPDFDQSTSFNFSTNPSRTSQQYFHQTSYNPDFMDLSSLPGMDFLNLASTSDPTSDPMAVSASLETSTAQTADDDWSAYGLTPGVDLGLGVGTVGLDFQHDWSNGVSDDLFDGFFFGNGGNGMS